MSDVPVITMPQGLTDEEFVQIREEIRRAFSGPGMMVLLPNTPTQAKPVVQFVACEAGDWIGCYVNGQLVDEGHSLYVVHLLEKVSDLLGFTLTDTVWFDDDQMDAMGNHFPERLEDINGQM